MTQIHYQIDEHEQSIEVNPQGEFLRFTVGEQTYQVKPIKITENSAAFIVNGRYVKAHFSKNQGTGSRQIWLDGHTWTVASVDPRKRRQQHSPSTETGALTASMPGQIRAVLVEVGELVTKGTPLILMEAMKMEMRLTAPHDGVIAAINCAVGDVVERGELLVVMDGS